MTADDTSREALIERVARVLDAEGAFCGECDNEPGGFYDECSQCRRFLTGYATAVVDAVVLPLVQERAEAWERGYMFAFAQERGDHTHSRPVPDYLSDDIRSWNPYLTPEQP